MRLNTGGPIILSTVAFALIAALIASDLISDGGEGVGLFHLLLEGTAFCVALIAAILTFRGYLATRRALSVARTEASHWRAENQELLLGLSGAIGKQFDKWGLTEAENEIGYLLLKGFSLGDIAGFRQTSERTVREQARAVYRKSGLHGRAELSAFFLEDLLVGLSVE